MSSLSKFIPNITAGHIRYFSTDQVDSAYLKCDGSTVLQNAYPNLYQEIGLIENNSNLDIWIDRTTGFGAGPIETVTYGDALYVLAGDNGKLYTSANLVTWTARTSNTINTINQVIYANFGKYVYVTSSEVGTSANAITWSSQSGGGGGQTVTYGGGIFVKAGAAGGLASSTDAITWTARTSGTASLIYALLYVPVGAGAAKYVYAGAGGVLATSTDGLAWTARTSGTISAIIALTYGDGLYVYAGQAGILATSTDAITWTARTSGTDSLIYALTYGDGLYVYGTNLGGLATSTDAITWTSRTSGTTSTIYDLTYNNKTYVYASHAGKLASLSPYAYEITSEFVLPESTKLLEDFNTLDSNITANQSVYIKAI